MGFVKFYEEVTIMLGTDQLKTIIRKKMKMATKGKKIFDKISCNFQISKNELGMVVFPDYDKQINYYGLVYLDEFLIRKSYSGAVIVTQQPILNKICNYFSKKIKKVCLLAQEDIECLIQYYNLYEFSKDIRFISLKQPEARNADRILGKKGLTMEHLVAVGIYELIPFEKIEPNLEYNDYDTAIKQFLSGVEI